MGKILVVGAGFAGAVFSRELASAGYQVDVIDKRPHIAGNAYDETSPEGIRVHRYGPHLFHTNNKIVVDWLCQFGSFVNYEHEVQALLPDGRAVPLPVNRTTINMVFDEHLQTEQDVKHFLSRLALPIVSPANAAEYLQANIGTLLTDLFFRPYTKKMWAMDLEEMAPEVVKRIPIRFDDERRYFPNDRYQIMPRDGYTAIFEKIFCHKNIKIHINQVFDKSMLSGYDHCFNSMPIDEYFDYCFDPLPYRSIAFHHKTVPSFTSSEVAAVTNFTDTGPRTRQTDWSAIPCHVVMDTGMKVLTQEEPCDYLINNRERYYPVKTSDGRYDQIYQKYKSQSTSEKNITFIGRCGTYQYLDMHQVINQSLNTVRSWLNKQ
jgi:UDP-galactopyranose mutase